MLAKDGHVDCRPALSAVAMSRSLRLRLIFFEGGESMVAANGRGSLEGSLGSQTFHPPAARGRVGVSLRLCYKIASHRSSGPLWVL
jgi:hypothetical protein